MKKGKTSKLQGFKVAKVMYGTVDSFDMKSVYLNIQTWVEPKKEVENWNRVVLNLNRSIKHTIHNHIDTNYFEKNFIVDLDLRFSGIVIGKKSFLNLDINLFLKEKNLDFKCNELKDKFKDITTKIFLENFKNNKFFNFYLTKKEGVVDNIL